MIDLMEKMSGTMHDMVRNTDQTVFDIADLRNHIADFDDFFRPIRNVCTGNPLFRDSDVLGGSVDFRVYRCSRYDDRRHPAVDPDLHQMDSLMPQMVSLMRPTVDSMKRMRVMMLTFQATQSGMQDQDGRDERRLVGNGRCIQRLV